MIIISGIGHHIKELRTAQGMTQSQLGAILGIEADAVELMELSAVPNLESDTIRHLSETFHTYPSTFLYESDEEFFKKAFNFSGEDINIANAFLTRSIAYQLLGRYLGAGAFEAVRRIAELNAEGINRAVSLIDDLLKIEDYRKGT